MHAGIGAAGPDDREPCLGDRRQCLLHRLLDGRRVRVPLPAGIVRPVILEDEFNVVMV